MALTQISADGIKDGQVKTADILDDNVTTAKIADDAVTDAKLANSINAAISANTAKTTNATHTGEVTGSGALTITDDVVDEANLKVSNSPTNGYFLSAQSGNTGGLTWAAAPSTVGGATGFDLNDNVKARFGTGDDLEIYHDGSNSIIKDAGTGQLQIATNQLRITNANLTEGMIKANEDGAVELLYDNAKKLETTSGGVSFNDTNITNVGNIALDSIKGDGDDDTNITFAGSDTITVKCGSTNPALTINTTQVKIEDSQKFIAGTGNDLEIYHDGNTHFINNTGWLKIANDDANTSEAIYIRPKGDENSVILRPNGNVELYYDHAKKLETTADGIEVTGKIFSSSHIDLADNVKLLLGTGDDLEIFHDGSHSYIKDTGTGHLLINTSELGVMNAAGTEDMIKATENGAVELYYDNAKKFETTSDGCLLGDDVKLQFGAGPDLEIYHTANSSCYIDNKAGALFIRNSVDDQDVIIQSDDGSGGLAHYIQADGSNGEVRLYHYGSERFNTSSTGATVTGILVSDGLDLLDDEFLRIGAGQDLELSHASSGSVNVINSRTGDLEIRHLAEVMAKFNDDGAVELYYDNVKKLETTSAGIAVTGDAAITDGAASVTVKSTNSNTAGQLHFDGDAVANADYWLGNINGRWNGNDVAAIRFESGSDTTNKDDGLISFHTSDADSTPDERMRIAADGRVHIGTSTNRLNEQLHVLGQGIVTSSAENTNMGLFGTFGGSDLLVGTFNANNVIVRRGNNNVARFTADGFIPNGTDTAAANALDDYEEGEWTITFTNSGDAAQDSSSHTKGRYVKIGGMVYFHFMIKFGSNGTVPPNNGTIFKSSLPFSTPSDSTNSLSRHIFTIMHQEIKMDDSRQEVVGYLTQNTSHMQYFEIGDDLPWQTLKNSNMNRTAMQMYVSGVMATV